MYARRVRVVQSREWSSAPRTGGDVGCTYASDRVSRKHLMQHDSNRPEVDLERIGRAVEEFGAHVLEGTDTRVLQGRSARLLVSRCDIRMQIWRLS